jgi:hypothetical protein
MQEFFENLPPMKMIHETHEKHEEKTKKICVICGFIFLIFSSSPLLPFHPSTLHPLRPRHHEELLDFHIFIQLTVLVGYQVDGRYT